MRNTSLRDLKLADTIAHMSELDMIHPNNDKVIKAVLETIGYDVKQKIDFIPSYHRDMQGKAAVGFQVLGEYNLDPKYDKFVDTIDRVVKAGYTDPHLARDMAELMGKRFSYKNEDEIDVKSNLEDDPRYYTEAEKKAMGFTGFDEDSSEEDFLSEHGGAERDCDMISSQIAALQALKVAVRGE